MDDRRLVYSTEKGRVCPECGRPAAQCPCKRKKGDRGHKPPPAYPRDGVIRIQRETKGRKGKTVTAVHGLPLEGDELRRLAQSLKRLCGAGGSATEGAIVIQGDHRQTLLDEIRKLGYAAKLAGG